jgi:hypothetical protein
MNHFPIPPGSLSLKFVDYSLPLYPREHYARPIFSLFIDSNLPTYSKYRLIAHVRHARFDSVPLYDDKKLVLFSDGGDCDSKKCKPWYGGVWQSPRSSGVWSQAGGSELVHFAGIRLQSPWRCHIQFIFQRNTYTFCTSNAIFRDDVATVYEYYRPTQKC